MKLVLSPRRDSGTDHDGSGVVLLGEFGMPAATWEADGSSREERLQRVLALLNEALQIIDGLQDQAVAGARLQNLIEALADESDRLDI